MFHWSAANRPRKSFYAREGLVTTALSWIVLSIVGAVPFVLSGAIPDPIDAFFEIVSGFTTTGSSILSDPTQMSYCINIWRCFSHWIGGMGVLVFILTLLPLAGGYHMNLMKAESPGPSVGKLLPKVQSTAKILYKIYIALTVALIISCFLGGCLFTTVSVQHLELPEPVGSESNPTVWEVTAYIFRSSSLSL